MVGCLLAKASSDFSRVFARPSKSLVLRARKRVETPPERGVFNECSELGARQILFLRFQSARRRSPIIQRNIKSTSRGIFPFVRRPIQLRILGESSDPTNIHTPRLQRRRRRAKLVKTNSETSKGEKFHYFRKRERAKNFYLKIIRT